MTPGGLTLLVGGACSGKSTLAVEIGRRHTAAGGTVSVVATAPRSLDDDLDARIARHRSDRPDWPTVEETTALGAAVRAIDDGVVAGRTDLPDHDAVTPRAPLVIVDCVTLWVSNLMLAGGDDDEVIAAATELGAQLINRSGPTVVITNEVGFGVHPGTELGRRYRDLLGYVNQRLAAVAQTTLLLVAGRALRLDDPLTLLTSDPDPAFCHGIVGESPDNPVAEPTSTEPPAR